MLRKSLPNTQTSMTRGKGKQSNRNYLKNLDVTNMANLSKIRYDWSIRKFFLKWIWQICRDRKLLKLTEMSFSIPNPPKSRPYCLQINVYKFENLNLDFKSTMLLNNHLKNSLFFKKLLRETSKMGNISYLFLIRHKLTKK